jgi:hypothetical protein
MGKGLPLWSYSILSVSTHFRYLANKESEVLDIWQLNPSDIIETIKESLHLR